MLFRSKQKDKRILCQKLTFDDRSDHVSLYGDVKVVKQNQEKFEGSHIILDLVQESFSAGKGVKTEFKL